MKKLFLIQLLMLSSAFAIADESGWCGSNLRWSYVEATKTVTISGTGSMYNYYHTSNLSPWIDRDDVVALIIEEGVTSIGSFAFRNCSSLSSVTIPKSITNIGEYAFQWCSALASVNISDFEAWCKIAFGNDCSNPLFGAHHLFLNGEEKRKIVIPNTITSIKNYAFCGFDEMVSINIPNSVTSIGIGAFMSCSGLSSINIPNSVTSIGAYAFDHCMGLSSVTIPNSLTSIGIGAFRDCNGIISVTIPNSVTTIGNYAFAGCSGLTSVTIGNSVASIGYWAFADCSGLTSVNISDLRAWCTIGYDKSGPSDIGSNPLLYAHHLFLNGEEIKDLVIPNSLTNIGGFAFAGCSGLSSVTIPSTIKGIGSGAFTGCI